MEHPAPLELIQRATDSTDPVELLHLADSYATTTVTVAVAGNPAIDDETVGLLMAEDSKVRAQLAKNPATGRRHLDVLLKDGRMRAHLAQRVGDPDVLREVYLGGRDDEVVSWICQNPSTPADVLASVARDEKAYRRIALAHSVRGPHTGEILTALADDRNPKVRYEAVRMLTLLQAA
ncbi:hypothetical protein [Leifsonia sp. Leaf264]|uniref:hypothetical protein n=1 Tax=Leifsonia sp. Leaf264 TaxID=1736314 RepID=UPI0006F1DDDD|nr:hypothetical protein [Leifsonia sp. Leaf264]KQO98651.1 hypothetical protein ASF30_11350 [Leifsonia sp. Leaf264]